jgi:hypothetical protein
MALIFLISSAELVRLLYAFTAFLILHTAGDIFYLRSQKLAFMQLLHLPAGMPPLL